MRPAPRADTRQGVLEGFSEDGVIKFLGVRYAAPPVGDLRWRAPQPPEAWSGLREAKRFGARAIQTVGGDPNMRVEEMSEDCLFLNVWTLDLAPAVKRPVMVYIHGGGNLGGAGSSSIIDGAKMATRGVVAVNFNYRLGAFGFLAHPDVGANFAVLDYVAALTWVRDNIAAFGGDPANVTVYGQSAGAVAVRTLLSCPMAYGLFHRAVIQSAGFEAPAFAPGWSYARAQKAAEQVFERLGGGGPDRLRHAPAEALGKASHEFCGIFPPPGQVHTPANLVWMPVPDEKIVLSDGFPGWPRDVPVMLGCVENESRYFIRPTGTYDWAVLDNMAKALCAPRRDELMRLFRASGRTPYECLDELYSAVIWTEPALETVRRFAADDRRFYYYHFARLAPGAIKSDERVKHAAELPYLFGNLTTDGWYGTDDARISRLLQDAWISFARDGKPSSPATLEWPAYREPGPKIAWIENEVSVRDFPITPVMALINATRRKPAVQAAAPAKKPGLLRRLFGG